MRALRRRDARVLVDDIEAPVISASTDVRVRVDVAGLCRTDLYVARGALPVREPLILGHEFTGEVVEAGFQADFQPGDKVTAIPLLPCRTCAACLHNGPCLQPLFLGLDLDGAFADQIVLDSGYLRKVPAGLDRRKAAYAEPVAAALAVLNAPISREQTGIVLGASRIALLTERILAEAGFANIARLGIGEAHGRTGEADFVIETEADDRSLQVMLDLLRPGGVAVLKSRPSRPVPFNLALAVKKDISLFGVSYGSFDRAIELLASDALGIEDFLGDSFALEDFERAFAVADASASLKIFLHIN